MYIESSDLETPGKKAKIWRYMDFTKFVSLLTEVNLFFCRVDKLGDPFEGTLSERDLRDIRESMKRPNPFKFPTDESESNIHDYVKHMRSFTFVNCWHISAYESIAMWKMYGEGDKSVAIQSTFGRFIESLKDCNENVYASKVRYINYDKDSTGGVWGLLVDSSPILYKRRSYKYENELRAIYWPPGYGLNPDVTISSMLVINSEPREEPAKHIPVNLEILVHRVFVSPDSPSWFVELVKSVSRKYGLRVPVKRSDLAKDPVG